jgi:hypothetical protein
MNKIIKVTHRLIDSVWTISFIDLGENKIELIGYNRDDVEGYANERDLGIGHLIENDDRIVVGAFINNVQKIVVNPKHIFDYGA